MNPRILVIDDDVLIRNTIRAALEMVKYEVVEAADGDDGISKLAEKPFDVVITDILMPNKEGIETIIHLRAEMPQVKIVAISGGNRKGGSFLDMAKKLGADLILKKPFRPQELLAGIADLLAD